VRYDRGPMTIDTGIPINWFYSMRDGVRYGRGKVSFDAGRSIDVFGAMWDGIMYGRDIVSAVIGGPKGTCSRSCHIIFKFRHLNDNEISIACAYIFLGQYQVAIPP